MGYLDYQLSGDDIRFCKRFREKIVAKIQRKPLPEQSVLIDLPMHMISLYNPAITPMIQYPFFNNLRFLEASEFPYVYLLMYEAGRPDVADLNYCFNGVSRALFPNPDKALRILYELGFIEDCTIEFFLTAAKHNDLSSLLKAVGIKSPPKKDDRLALVLENVGEDILKQYLCDHKVIAPSPLGYCMIQSLFYHVGESLYAIEKLKRDNGVSGWSFNDITPGIY